MFLYSSTYFNILWLANLAETDLAKEKKKWKQIMETYIWKKCLLIFKFALMHFIVISETVLIYIMNIFAVVIASQ